MGTVTSQKQPDMGLAGLLFGCCFIVVTTSLPPVFDDYFDEDVKIVDVSQEVAIEACLQPSTALINKISAATKVCLGGDDKFDWEDFSTFNEGADTDQNGLSVKLENAEACFYGEMGWLVNKVVKKDVVIADFASLGGNVKATFVANINQCSSWNGELSSSRKRRSVEEPEVGEQNVENVESGGLLGWVKSLVRSKRQVNLAPKKKIIKKPPPAKIAPLRQHVKSIAKKQIGAGAGVKSQGGPMKKKLPLQRPLARSAQGGQKKKKKKKTKKIIKKNGPARKSPPKSAGLARTIDLEIYNKLWCFDLAVGKALKKCVEDKLKN